MAKHIKTHSTRAINDLTAEFARSQLSYNPKTGIMRWKKRRANRIKIGSIAGTTTLSGYYAVSISPRRYYVHRLAFLIMKGRWPKQDIDHINGDKLDNRWNNIREATRGQNNYNARQRRNKNGHKGVSKRKDGKFTASIKTKTKLVFLGVWDQKCEAAAAYIGAAKVLHDKFFYSN